MLPSLILRGLISEADHRLSAGLTTHRLETPAEVKHLCAMCLHLTKPPVASLNISLASTKLHVDQLLASGPPLHPMTILFRISGLCAHAVGSAVLPLVSAPWTAYALLHQNCSTVMWSVVLHDPAWRTCAVISRLLLFQVTAIDSTSAPCRPRPCASTRAPERAS